MKSSCSWLDRIKARHHAASALSAEITSTERWILRPGHSSGGQPEEGLSLVQTPESAAGGAIDRLRSLRATAVRNRVSKGPA